MKIRKHDLSRSPRNQEHAEYGVPPQSRSPMSAATAAAPTHLVLRAATWFTAIAISALAPVSDGAPVPSQQRHAGLQTIASMLQGKAFWTPGRRAGLAQAVDGALGMAYGVTASSFLLGTGPARRSPARACTSPRSSPPASPASRTSSTATSTASSSCACWCRERGRGARRAGGYADRWARAQALHVRVPAGRRRLHPEPRRSAACAPGSASRAMRRSSRCSAASSTRSAAAAGARSSPARWSAPAPIRAPPSARSTSPSSSSRSPRRPRLRCSPSKAPGRSSPGWSSAGCSRRLLPLCSARRSAPAPCSFRSAR